MASAPTIKITFRDKQMGAKFKASMNVQYRALQKATGASVVVASREIKQRGDADIRKGGNFGKRWTDGFHSNVVLRGTAYTIRTFHDIFYFTVFEFGARIKGKPLLWIPLSFARDAQGKNARDYGRLFRVDRKGGKAPLLLSWATKEPKYFGKASVRIPRKFHIRDICRDVAKKLKIILKNNIAAQKKASKRG